MVLHIYECSLTLSQIRTIISTLVDPEARNNDNLQAPNTEVNPKQAIKYLRLVAPKCDDYLLTCRWNSAGIKLYIIYYTINLKIRIQYKLLM
jgi:hypothetical protein